MHAEIHLAIFRAPGAWPDYKGLSGFGSGAAAGARQRAGPPAARAALLLHPKTWPGNLCPDPSVPRMGPCWPCWPSPASLVQHWEAAGTQLAASLGQSSSGVHETPQKNPCVQPWDICALLGMPWRIPNRWGHAEPGEARGRSTLGQAEFGQPGATRRLQAARRCRTGGVGRRLAARGVPALCPRHRCAKRPPRHRAKGVGEVQEVSVASGVPSCSGFASQPGEAAALSSCALAGPQPGLALPHRDHRG